MPTKIYKGMLLLAAVILLAGSGFLQQRLVRDRDALGLTRYTELKGAPPVLMLTTVALGGFRGLISNALWMRASDLQDNDKFFEMMQLADWITKLEPHFTQVWINQAWNMAYNISVKFKDPADRWRWVKAGFELLRDEGLKYNPNDVLMFRELSWIFQHKMGANLDDAHIYYKQMWANQMTNIFGKGTPSLEPLLNPTNAEQEHRLFELTNVFKMDPKMMKEVDDRYGPLEWRLPEAHAIYWAALGLKYAEKDPRRFGTNELMTLHRSIFQSMQLSFQRGHLIANKAGGVFEFGPNLDIIPNVDKAYREAWTNELSSRPNIENAEKNFIRDAIYELYINDRKAEALYWFRYYETNEYGKSLMVGTTNATPENFSLDQYVVAMIADQVNSGDKDRLEGIIEGIERTAFKSLVLDQDERYPLLEDFARRVVDRYNAKIKGTAALRVSLTRLQDIRQYVLTNMLEELPPLQAAVLRSKLHLPPPSQSTAPSAPAPSTNAPPAGSAATNAPPPGSQ